MNYILFDGPSRKKLLPFTFTRPVADIRVGILTIREKWEHELDATTTTVTEDYLADKYPMVELEDNIMINASYLPNRELIEMIKALEEQQAIFNDEDVIAFYSRDTQETIDFSSYQAIEFREELLKIESTTDIFNINAEAIKEDFDRLTRNRQSSPIPQGNHVIGHEAVFIEAGAKLNFCTLNATQGPIYIGKDSEIMEGSTIRGPFALLDRSVVKMGTKIYGATTVGPVCTVGGEIKNSVIFGYSNKGHEGFLGNSVIGEWCNIGADTNTSNLKNNYDEVKLWSYETERFLPTGLQFCGLMMGDHSKCGINTMFNTGTVVGVSANVYGTGFPRNFIPSFSWGGASGMKSYRLDKAFEVATRVMARRDLILTDTEKDILQHVYDTTSPFRKG